MSRVDRFRYWFKAWFYPPCWVQIHTFSDEWDWQLRSLMKGHKFKYESQYYAKLAGLRIWIENHPYGSFTDPADKCRPRRSTILYAMDKLQRDTH